MGLILLAAVAAACFGAATGRARELSSGLAPGVQREIQYAEALHDMNLPDYARIVLERIQDPAAKPMIKVLRMRALAARGQWDAVKEIIAREPDQAGRDVWAMKLTLADNYYAWGKYPEAQAIYESLFAAYPAGPPEALNDFFVDSAYRYARMLRRLERHPEAAGAYDQILKAKLSKGVRRQVLTEKAETLLVAADNADPAGREEYLKPVEALCEEILWVQDLWFGKAIVLLAHVRMMRGNPEAAMALVEEYGPQLKALDALLREDEENSGQALTQLSPIAECRYLLGVMMHDEAEALLAGNGTKERIVDLLIGTKKDKDGKERSPGALQHLLNVFIRYADTPWAADAGRRAERIESLLEAPPFNAKIKTKITPQQMRKVERLQFQGARLQYAQNQFREAAEHYVRVLNLFPERESSVAALGELARCYVELTRPLYAEMAVHHLAERFAKHPAYSEKAGEQVLRMALFYAERNRRQAHDATLRLFWRHFPTHPSAPLSRFRFAEDRFKNQAYPEALDHYRTLVARFPDSPLRRDALSRIVACYAEMEDPVAEIKALQDYIEALEQHPRPGQALIAAKYREAVAYRALGPQYVIAAFNRLFRLEQWLSGADRATYEQTDAERRGNDEILQAVLYNKAGCYAVMPPPEGQSDAYRRQQAIHTLETLVRDFPASEFAANALSRIATLWTLLDRPAEADKALRRLQAGYPESPEAENALFMQAMNLLKMNRKREALAAFQEMFSARAEYTPRQILSAGTELLQAGEFAMARDAFDRVLDTATGRELREPALLRKGIALMESKAFADAAEVFDALLTEYPRSGFTIEACLHLGQACAALGRTEPDPRQRLALFNRAIDAMNRARKLETEPAGKARLDLALARILHRRAMAEEAFGSPSAATAARNASLATYQKLILFGDRESPAIRPHIETAYFECIPLLFAAEKWQYVLDDAETYLQTFREGRFTRDVRAWRSRARVKLLALGRLPATDMKE